MEYLIRMIATQVWSELGPGFSERVYHNAFEVALRLNTINYETERIIPIFFQGHNVGNVRADLILNNTTIVELKSISRLKEENRIQLQNYMKLTRLTHGVLVNFPSTQGDVEVETFFSQNSNESGISTVSHSPDSGSIDWNLDVVPQAEQASGP